MNQIATGIGWAVLLLGGFCIVTLFAAFTMNFILERYQCAIQSIRKKLSYQKHPVAWAILDKWGQIDGGLADGKHPPYPPDPITGVQNWAPLYAPKQRCIKE